MYKVTVVDRDGDKFVYESVQDVISPGGTLQLFYADGSKTIYAQGAWLEADVEEVKEDYQV
jgi:hypothetical protein